MLPARSHVQRHRHHHDAEQGAQDRQHLSHGPDAQVARAALIHGAVTLRPAPLAVNNHMIFSLQGTVVFREREVIVQLFSMEVEPLALRRDTLGLLQALLDPAGPLCS